MDKKQKREMVRDILAKQRAEERATFPLSVEELRNMFEFVDGALMQEPCDHTRRHTTDWLKQHGHPVEPMLAWLNTVGGCCDCEVAMNAGQHVDDAMGD